MIVPPTELLIGIVDWCAEGAEMAGKLYAQNNAVTDPMTQQQCTQWCRNEAACTFIVHQPSTGGCKLMYNPLL